MTTSETVESPSCRGRVDRLVGQPFYDADGITIYHADCREVLPLLNCEIDALVTDPPYAIVNRFGVSIKSDGSRRTLEFPWDNAEGVAEGVAEACKKLKGTSSAFVFTGLDSVGFVVEVVRDAGFTVKPAAWVKECPCPPGHGNWWPSGFELAFYGYRNSPWFGDTDPKRSNVFVSDSYRFGQPGKVDHPTQKPLGLMRRIVCSIVPPGGVCIDPFMGSGTTLVAAKLDGRRAIGIERELKYCEIAVSRLRQGVLFGDAG